MHWVELRSRLAPLAAEPGPGAAAKPRMYRCAAVLKSLSTASGATIRASSATWGREMNTASAEIISAVIAVFGPLFTVVVETREENTAAVPTIAPILDALGVIVFVAENAPRDVIAAF